MEGPATLAEFTGRGGLAPEETEAGEVRLAGFWQADDPERAYEALHRLYMARERIPYRGPATETGDAREERQLDVIILEWTNDQHPASLKLQEAFDDY